MAKLKGSPVDDLVKTVLLEEKGGSTTATTEWYTLRYAQLKRHLEIRSSRSWYNGSRNGRQLIPVEILLRCAAPEPRLIKYESIARRAQPADTTTPPPSAPHSWPSTAASLTQCSCVRRAHLPDDSHPDGLEASLIWFSPRGKGSRTS